MPKVLRVRALSEEESRGVQRLVRARSEPVRRFDRARIVWASHQGEHVPAIAARLDLSVYGDCGIDVKCSDQATIANSSPVLSG